MRACLADPGRGRAIGRAASAVGALIAVVGWAVFATPSLSHLAGLVEGAGLVLALLSGTIGRWRRNARAGELTFEPGRVLFRADGRAGHVLPAEEIRARDILGATAAADRTGVTLAIARASRPAEPTLLTLEKEADAEDVRRVLGIGHGGRGAVAWRTYVPWDERATLVVSWLLAGFVAWFAVHETAEDSVVALTILALYAVPVLLGMWALRGPGKRILLTPYQLELYERRAQTAPQMIPYGAISQVEATPRGLSVALGETAPHLMDIWTGRHPLAGMSRAERDQLVAQIDAAVQRAHGRARPRADATARLEALRRCTPERNGTSETPGAWFARLDATAASLAHVTGYRGTHLEPADLWTVLEDPDAELELRFAAARVLSRQMDKLPLPAEVTNEHAVRVATAVAAAEPEVERKLRLAVDFAAEEIDEATFAEMSVAPATKRQIR